MFHHCTRGGGVNYTTSKDPPHPLSTHCDSSTPLACFTVVKGAPHKGQPTRVQTDTMPTRTNPVRKYQWTKPACGPDITLPPPPKHPTPRKHRPTHIRSYHLPCPQLPTMQAAYTCWHPLVIVWMLPRNMTGSKRPPIGAIISVQLDWWAPATIVKGNNDVRQHVDTPHPMTP
jgi:hypothetical protein